MTNTVKVDLPFEAVVGIVTADLMESYRGLKRDLENPLEVGGVSIDANIEVGGVFSYDHDEDVAEIKRHIDAFRTVLEYYGVDVDE